MNQFSFFGFHFQSEPLSSKNKEKKNQSTKEKDIENRLVSIIQNPVYDINMEDFNDMENCQGLLKFNNKENCFLDINNQMEIDDENHKEKEEVNEFNKKFSLLKTKKLRKNKKNEIETTIKEKNKKEKKISNNLNESNSEITDDQMLISNNCSQINSKAYTSLILQDFPSMDDERIKEECKKFGLKTNSISLKNLKKTLNEIYTFMNTQELPQIIHQNLHSFLENKNQVISSQNLFCSLSEDKKEKIVLSIKKNKLLYQKVLLFKRIDLKEIKRIISEDEIIVNNELLKNFLLELGVVLACGWD